MFPVNKIMLVFQLKIKATDFSGFYLTRGFRALRSIKNKAKFETGAPAILNLIFYERTRTDQKLYSQSARTKT